MAERIKGAPWLAAALSGGLPEPGQQRWQPLRVGIVNLWEYDRAEFWFADGRLVLRGGNGAGKTKVLELTTLMLLRGTVDASVLDPFGSQHRTMRFNLLSSGDGDDPRPQADSGLGYAWAEFGRRTAAGELEFFVCGLGASARRGTGAAKVEPWQFTTQLRPGKDFELISAGRALEHKELNKVAGVTVFTNAGRYRTELATRLFGLDVDGYDNLTELLKQLRKPKLGEKLNPASLAETLRAALPPLASTEIEQLAEGWERLEELRKRVEKTKEAATYLAAFVRNGWLPWARSVVRSRADALTTATTEFDNTTKARREANEGLEQARLKETALREERTGRQQEQADVATALRELLVLPAYLNAQTAAGRVESLKSQVSSLNGQHERATARRGVAADAVTAAEKALATAGEKAAAAHRELATRSNIARSAAESAGLADSARRHLITPDIAALRADLATRKERFAHARGLFKKFERARDAAEKSAIRVELFTTAVQDAAAARTQTEQELSRAAGALVQQIREWAASNNVAVAPVPTLDQWCDLVDDLASTDLAAEQQPAPVAAIGRHLEGIRTGLRDTAESLRLQRNPLIIRQRELTAELADVRARTETAPPTPALWQRRARPSLEAGAGAPLWRCVQPAAGMDGTELDLLEAVLAAAGLLDAWIYPDGSLQSSSAPSPADIRLTGRAGAGTDDSLATVLTPTPVGGVSAQTISSVLRGIGWHRTVPAEQKGSWLAADGHWSCGRLSGRAEVSQAASFVGASAREAARQRTIADLEATLADLASQLGTLKEQIDGVQEQLSDLDAEQARMPSERAVHHARSLLGRCVAQLADACRNRDTAQRGHDEDVRVRDSAWAEFTDYAATHRFPTELAGVADGLASCQSALDALAAQLDAVALLDGAAEKAAADLDVYRAGHTAAETERQGIADELRTAKVALQTASQALELGHRELLARRDSLDGRSAQLGTEIERLNEAVNTAAVAANTAQNTLNGHEVRRVAAEAKRDGALAKWWKTFDAGLSSPLGFAEPERRTVEAARETSRAARRELTPLGDAAATGRAWRRCQERLNELRSALLPNRDAGFSEDEDSGDAIPRVQVLIDSSGGWQAPRAAANALAAQVAVQENSYDAEQQRVLATLLGSTFIEHLKDRLDYTAKTFTEINAQLEAHPTRHGHAVRLNCDADPQDPDARAVIDALSQGYRQLTEARQAMVREFLARKIDRARADAAADHSRDWRAQLAAALDYRGWLRISIQYRPGSASKFVAFDAARHGAKSGGEKVVLLSQPLFAAAVVAYNAAAGGAPRWVWLDEAMTGVDDEIKASFMGLTVDFDLDVMLTAHDEWCRYSTVPAVAVYDLARQKHLPGVDAQPYLWCGGEWTELAVAPQPMAEAPDPLADGLFGAE